MPLIELGGVKAKLSLCFGGGQCRKHACLLCTNHLCRPDDDALGRNPKFSKVLSAGKSKRGHFRDLGIARETPFLMMAPYDFLVFQTYHWNHAEDLENSLS